MNRILVFMLGLLWVIDPIVGQTSVKDEVVTMLNRASELKQNGNNAEAIKMFIEVGKQTEGLNNEEGRQMYVFSQIMACSCYFANKQYAGGYSLAKSLLMVSLNDEEKDFLYEQYVLNGYMLACDLMRHNENNNADYKRARELLKELAPYADEQFKGYVLPKIPLTWYLEAVQLYSNQMFEKAFVCYNNALEGYRKLGIISGELSTLKQMASVSAHLDNVDEAIGCYEQALVLARQVGNVADQMEIAKDLYNLHDIAGHMEDMKIYSNMMDSLFDRVCDIETHFVYYRHKGKEKQAQKHYNIAEQWFLKCKAIVERQDETAVGVNKFLVYSDMSDLYSEAERYDQALKYGLKALEECQRDGNSTIRNYYLSYVPIIDIYCQKGDKGNCYKYLDSLFMVEPYLDEPRELSKLYATRGSRYFDFKDYENALADYKRADEILALKYPVMDGERAGLYALLGGTEHRLNHYDVSEHYYKLYADAIKEIYGGQSINYINSQIYLANAQGFAGHINEGCDNYTSAVATLKETIRKRIPYMNTAEREGFWNPLSSLLTRMTPYALKAELYKTEYTKTCYDALLLSKAFLLDSERSVYDIIQREGDETDMQTYMNIALLNNQIKEWQKNYVQYADSILAATNKVSRLEGSLMSRCKSVGNITSFMDVDYSAVKESLGKNDVLIDFTDFVPDAGDRRYAAYIVYKKQKYPLLKSLFAESQIDSLGVGHPALFYDEEDIAPEIIRLLWNPLKDYVVEGATIYYVPSQMLFQVCLESLPLEDGTLLGDHYNFVRLSSARELVRKQNSDKSGASSAILYGGLQYDLKPEVMAENAKQYDLSSLMVMRGGDIVRGDSIFRELPGSKVEIERITEILKQSGFAVTPYMGMNGTEESFLNMHRKSPRILHLATHGFYYTPTEAEEVDYLRGYSDAMSLSGLIMSGGNAAWRGKELPEGTLGGVLTANNIARLDLSSTDMVVLSACQTGQGDATAEGLYGLQRAFKKAGVGTMVMTLWSVSDKVTTEFMIKFYESLTENDWDKHKAFEETKSYIRTQHPDPYHWAAFVMLD